MKNLQLYESYGSGGKHADKEKRIELLQEAGGKLNEAIDLIEKGLMGTNHFNHAKAYIISNLNNWMDSTNRFDKGIQQYIDEIELERESEETEERE